MAEGEQKLLDGTSYEISAAGENRSAFVINGRGMTFTYDDEKSVVSRIEQLLNDEKKLTSMVKGHISIEPVQDGAQGLFKITIIGGSAVFNGGVPAGTIAAFLKPGTYYALCEFVNDGDGTMNAATDDGLLLVEDKNTVTLLEDVSLEPVDVVVVNEQSGNAHEETRKELWSIYSDFESRHALLSDLQVGISICLSILERDAKTGGEIEVIPTVTGKLDHMPVNHSFESRVLEGLEHIPYTDDGEWKLSSSNARSRQRAVLKANPASCTKFISHENANWELALRILSTISDLLKKPESKQARAHGLIWITTSKIIDELTRTKRGVNQTLRRNDGFRETVSDAIAALSSAQIEAYGPKGDMIFLDSILHATYRAEVKDRAGNTLKDVWGFPDTEKSTAFASLTAKQTANAPLLDMGPMNANQAWIPQFLRGEVISIIRGALYPSRGKGQKSKTVSVSWDSIFETADVKAGGDITSRRKKRIVKDIQDILAAMAENERGAEKPVYIQAESTRISARGRGKGAWGMLKVTGYRTPRKTLINLLDSE